MESARAELTGRGGSAQRVVRTAALAQPSRKVSRITANRSNHPASASPGDMDGSRVGAARISPVWLRSESVSSSLTPREHEVLALIARGYSNRQIADELVITCGTAANHVAHILAKLNCHNRTELVIKLLESATVDEPGTPARSGDAS